MRNGLRIRFWLTGGLGSILCGKPFHLFVVLHLKKGRVTNEGLKRVIKVIGNPIFCSSC